MSDIDDLRTGMNQITLDMVKLLNRRIEIAREIGRVKQTMGKSVTDEAREGALRRKVISLAGQMGLEEELATRFLNFLISESVRIQSYYQDQPPDRQTHLSVFLRAKDMEQNGRKIVHMEVGEPDFMPPQAVRNAMVEAFDRGHVRYGNAKGMQQLRSALALRVSDDGGRPLGPENVMVTPGARFAVFLSISTLLHAGDEMIVIEPAWPAYADCALHAGVKVRPVRTSLEGGWEPDPGEISAMINPNTKMIVLNYPNNPTGKVLPAPLQDKIVGLARQNGLYVLSDEIYAQYSRVPFKSVLEYGYDRSIVTQSFSKSHAMTGFRVGCAIAGEQIIERMASLQALSLTSIAEPMQYAALAALKQDTSQNSVSMGARLDLLAEKAREAGLEFSDPDGGMYLFARTGREGFDGTEFSAKALEEGGLAVAPGRGFGNYGEFIRISACRDEKTIKEGMSILSGIIGE